eukprot:gene11025-12272_t
MKNSFHPEVILDAEFAVEELRKLSDSGIYTTLTLHRILHAQTIDGIFHNNLALKLELKSPFFNSGQETEVFEMVVMKHKTDNVTSLAIDEFPVMADEAIEEFYIQKVEEHRVEREKSLRRLDREVIQDSSTSWAKPSLTGEVISNSEERSHQQVSPFSGSSQSLDNLSLRELHALLMQENLSPTQRKAIQQQIRLNHANEIFFSS